MEHVGSQKRWVPAILSVFLVAIQWGLSGCAPSHKHYTEQTLKLRTYFTGQGDLTPNDTARFKATPVHLIHGLCPYVAGQQPPEGAPASGDRLESHRDLCLCASQAGEDRGFCDTGPVLRSICCTLHLVGGSSRSINRLCLLARCGFFLK